jgi:hypothetical protein
VKMGKLAEIAGTKPPHAPANEEEYRTMTSAELVNRVVEGMPLTEALAAFVAACRRPDTLFITERWFAPRREKLLARLSDPITQDEAHVLHEVLWERLSFNAVFDWLDEKPVSWEDYHRIQAGMAEHSRSRVMVEGIFPWSEVESSRADVELQRRAKEEAASDAMVFQLILCPCCNRPVTWIYFSSPSWTWEKHCGRAGWLGICDPCRMQVDFSLVVMN